jgi:hypothetical protein
VSRYRLTAFVISAHGSRSRLTIHGAFLSLLEGLKS